MFSFKIEIEEGRDGLSRPFYKRNFLHHIGENLAQIGQLIQKIAKTVLTLGTGIRTDHYEGGTRRPC